MTPVGNNSREPLRVAFVVGCLGNGGAEKQLVYMARALTSAGVDVRLFSLTRGEFYEQAVRDLGIPIAWIGRFSNPVWRLGALVRALRTFRPHIVQSTHFFANLYAAAAARVYGSISIGAIRSDAKYEMDSNKRFGRRLFEWPSALIANSIAAMENAKALGLRDGPISYLPNVIDLSDFDKRASSFPQRQDNRETVAVISVGNFFPKKRFDRFLRAIAGAKSRMPCLRGMIAGDGPGKEELEALARTLGFSNDDNPFLGRRNDIPALMKGADIFVLPSDHEGFPNVLLEAMAAGLPAVTTAAGDSGRIVVEGVTGYVVPFDDGGELAERILLLAASKKKRELFGRAGRRRVEERYSFEILAARLLSLYYGIAAGLGNRRVADRLSAYQIQQQWSEEQWT